MDRKTVFEKLSLWLNKTSTSFGEKWEKGVRFILFCWILSFSFLVMLRDGVGGTFIWTDKKYIRESFVFLWDFASFEVFKDLSLWGNTTVFLIAILAFIIGKVLIVYGVYQTISAFRKKGK